MSDESVVMLDEYVNAVTGEIDRRIFSDPEIFEMEMSMIFGRAWLFLCHESQIRKPGDFFETQMGRDSVLVVRQKDGSIRALLNTCRHRGNAVCRAEEGNVKNFMCTYHGWTYGLDGALIGVPGITDFYFDELDKTRYPLRQIAQLDSYKGFVFGTLDATAPPLTGYLGATGRLSLDLIAERGAVEVVPGIQKFVLNTNWKYPMDNSFDFYHPNITHISAQAVGMVPSTDTKDQGGARTEDGTRLSVQRLRTDLETIVVLSEYGHAISGPTLESVEAVSGHHFTWRDRPGVKEVLGPVGERVGGHPHVFPNSWITVDGQLSLRIPRSATQTEVWWFSFRSLDETPEEQQAQLSRQIHSFGPAGFLEQEDGENWSQSTLRSFGQAERRIPQLLKMGLGRGKIVHDYGLARIEAPVNEHAQLWTYLAWKEWLKGSTWEDLRHNTIPGNYL
jgi:phenylpropionate dioxygenase-like ring-hydroxylating dioxygenase large terminal subunit